MSAGPRTWCWTPSAARWQRSLNILRAGGRLVALGATAGEAATIDVRGLYLQQKQILGTKMGSPTDFRALLALVDGARCARCWTRSARSTTPPRRMPRVEAGEHFGKLRADDLTKGSGVPNAGARPVKFGGWRGVRLLRYLAHN